MARGVDSLVSDSGVVGRQLVCLEVNPPKGTDIEPVLARYRGVHGVDLFNVTDSALAKMRMSGLMFAALCKERLGIEPVVNLSCRDRNLIGLQSDLLGAWALGIRSVVALTGDAVTVGDLPDAKGVFEVNSIGLLGVIHTLNQGRDLAGSNLKGCSHFVPGVVFNPNVKNPGAEIRRLQKKKDAGAVYGLSQPVFDAGLAEQFFKAAETVGLELFVGVLPFKSRKTMDGIVKVPGIKIPQSAIERVESVPEAGVSEVSIQMALEVCQRCRPYVRGYHVISGGTPLLAIELCTRIAGDAALMQRNQVGSSPRSLERKETYEAP
jgi:5,10-methylenetetrahydrofolate reductase